MRKAEKLFPDLDAAKFIEEQAKKMAGIGIDPAIIYAFRKTQMLATSRNWQKFTPAQQKEWEAAIDEYGRLHKK